MVRHKCSKCGVSLLREEVWIPDNMKDKREFCGIHAPETAIRLKDTMRCLGAKGGELTE